MLTKSQQKMCHSSGQARLERSTAVPQPPRWGESSQILVADDEAGSRLGFRVALETAGYEVTEAEDGERALRAIREAAVDLALLDLRMPGLDGMEVLRRIRDEGIAIPVVVVTAFGSVPCAIRALELGATDFLAKPVEPAVLRRTVLEVLLRCSEGADEPHRPAASSLSDAARQFAETLALAWRAWERGQLELTDCLLQRALELDPDSAAANTLRGELHEKVGEQHAAYQSYRRALARDRHHDRALDGLRRYRERFGLDCNSKAINPGAE